MAIKMVRCSVIGEKVACVTDVAGDTIVVMCSARDVSTAQCRFKDRKAEGGPLSRLLMRGVGAATSTRDRRCHVRAR